VPTVNRKVVNMTVHAAERVAQCNITTDEIRRIIEQGDVIEDCPDDPSGRRPRLRPIRH